MGDTRLEPLVLSDAERRTLENWAKRRKTAQGLALRARIVLACAEGRSNTAVAARLRVSRTTVRKWRDRFLARRLDGLGDEPRPGVPRTISDARVEEVVVRTLEQVPEGATHWSKRELARQVGISATSVHRIFLRTTGMIFRCWDHQAGSGSGSAACGVTDGRGHQAKVGIVEAGQGVPEVYWYAVAKAGGEAEYGSWPPARAVTAAAQSMLAMAVVPSLMLTAAWMKRSRKSARCGQDVAMSNSPAASA
jgi:transposase